MDSIPRIARNVWEALFKTEASPAAPQTGKQLDSRVATFVRSAGKVDWQGALDYRTSLDNCKSDMTGDWHRDPWGWAELDWIVTKKQTDLLTPRVHNPRVLRASRLDVAKEGFGTRPAIVMDPIDRLIYQALVDQLSPRLVSQLRRWVYGWRLPPGTKTQGAYAHQDYQWDNFRNHLHRLAPFHDCVLKTDIVSCFATIPIDPLSEEIARRAGSSILVERLILMVLDWQRIPDRSGLPQRSLASCVLANMYLSPIDDVLAQHNSLKEIVGSFVPEGSGARWMDDIWLFGRQEGRLRSAQLDLSNSMRDLKLEMNFGKTDVFTGEDLEKEVEALEHSAVDKGLNQSPMDSARLEQLVEEILERPEHASRTSLRFIGTRMRNHAFYKPLAKIVDKAERMPHGADHLARVFRDSEAWKHLQGWFVDYLAGDWGSIRWSGAQFGTMFPSSKKPDQQILDCLEATLSGEGSISMTALAAQRLAAWDPDRVRAALREAARESEQPHSRRILALAALSAGEQRQLVRKVLSEFEENLPVLRMLEDQNFVPPPIASDYEAG